MRRLLTIGIFLALVALATAQPGPAAMPSLEWLTQQSKLIVRGKIVSVEPLDSSFRGDTLRLSVVETLKGPEQHDISFLAYFGGSPGNIAKEWMARGHDVLAFLTDAKPVEGRFTPLKQFPHDYTLVGYRAEMSMYELAADAEVHPVTMAIDTVTNPADIVRLVKEGIKVPDPPDGLRTYFLRLQDLPALPRYDSTGMGVELSVPVDSRLEALARTWVASKDGEPREMAIRASSGSARRR